MFHVIGMTTGREYFKTEFFALAKECAENMKQDGDAFFIIEERKMVWTTQTLGDLRKAGKL